MRPLQVVDEIRLLASLSHPTVRKRAGMELSSEVMFGKDGWLSPEIQFIYVAHSIGTIPSLLQIIAYYEARRLQAAGAGQDAV